MSIRLLLCVLFLNSPSAAQQFPELWKLEGVFTMPESAALDADAGFIYVSNVNEYAKDGNGFISRVSLDGTQVELHWLAGLDSPTGVAVFDERLYFADFDSLKVADTNTGTVIARYLAPDSNPALNDVAISTTGQVFVSGSASNSIYVLDGDELRLWLHDDTLLQQANGLYVLNDALVHGGRYWNVFDLDSAELLQDRAAPIPELNGIDGISRDICGDYLVTLIDDARLWRVRDGSASPLSEAALNGIDLHAQSGYIALPQVGGHLTLYRQRPENCIE